MSEATSSPAQHRFEKMRVRNRDKKYGHHLVVRKCSVCGCIESNYTRMFKKYWQVNDLLLSKMPDCDVEHKDVKTLLETVHPNETSHSAQ